MPRNVKIPRVVIPTKTSEILMLSLSVSGYMEEDVDMNVPGPSTQSWITIWETMNAKATAASAKLTAAVAKENEASALRAELAVLNSEQTTELRNARDLIMSLNPENPMEVANYGFTAYTSGASSDGTPNDLPEDEEDDGSGITPA